MAKSVIGNPRVAELLNEAAVLLELSGANYFRIRAYQKAAQVIEGLTSSAVSMTGEELTALRGIGKGIAGHLGEIARTGSFSELEALRKKIPAGMLELLKIQGIGAKRAKLLYEKLGVDSVDKLKELSEKGELEKLEGFGKKSEANILSAVKSRARSGGGRMLHWRARLIAEDLLKLAGSLGLEKAAYAGSLRRGKETVGDIDILAAGRPDGTATGKFSRLDRVEKILSVGPTKCSVILKDGIQCDLRIVPAGTYGAALNYFTGSKEHNVALRELALSKGLTLSEYGLCRTADKEHKRPVAALTEEEIYRALGLDYIPPELREGRGEIELARKGKLPRLIEFEDVKGDIHNHTALSDGSGTMEEMLARAAGLGFKWVFLGDHSKPLGIANGLDFKQYEASRADLDRIAAKFPKLGTGRSLEMEILKDGSLGFSEKEAPRVDFIVGALHSAFKLPRDEMTARLIKAMKSGYVDAVAHPSGRLLGKREPVELDYDRVFEAAARAGTAFEINGQPDRQDLSDVTARQAKEAGVKILLSTDAHSPAQLEYMRMAVIVARRAGLTSSDVLNTLSFRELQAWIKARRP